MRYIASISLLLLLGACKTSGQLRGTQYEDPTQIQTIELGEGEAAPEGPANPESLLRQLEVARGELENLRYSSEQEIQQLRQQNAELEETKQKLSEEILRYRGEKAPSTSGSQEGAELLWRNGVQALNKGQFPEAQSSFQSLLSSYPKDSHVFGSTLLLGLTQYRLKDFKNAALTFNQAIDRAPKRGVGGAVAWFSQGASFHQLGQAEDAKLFFEEVVRRYPKAHAAVLARGILARKSKVPADLFQAFPKWPTYVP